MISIPFTILGLAAGVYLLLQVKHYGFGGIYKVLAWLVVLLSLASFAFAVTRGVMHHRHHHHFQYMDGHCDMRSLGGPGGCPSMRGDHGPMQVGPLPACCGKDSGAIHDGPSAAPCCQKGAASDSSSKK